MNPFSLIRNKKKFIEVVLLLCFAGSIAVLTYTAAVRFPQELYDAEYMNSWFEADINRVYLNMTERVSLHYRTKVHPLFSITFCPAVYFFNRHLLHLPKATVVHLILALNAFGWVVLCYAVLRMITGRILDSVCYTLLALSSSSVLFWFAVPETFPFGSLTILVAIAFAMYNRRRPPADWWYIVIGIITMSMTITNWMAGIIVTFCQKHYKKAIQLTIYVFAAVTLLWGVQKMIFPSAEFFLGDWEEMRYINRRAPWKTGESFFIHPIVIPEVSRDINKEGNVAVKISDNDTHSSTRTIGICLWLLVFIAGMWSLSRYKNDTQMKLIIFLIFAGQLLLHVVYGKDIFLFSPHFLPLLVFVAAFSSLSKLRKIALLLVVALIIVAAVNNYTMYKKSIQIIKDSASRNMVPDSSSR